MVVGVLGCARRRWVYHHRVHRRQVWTLRVSPSRQHGPDLAPVKASVGAGLSNDEGSRQWLSLPIHRASAESRFELGHDSAISGNKPRREATAAPSNTKTF
jgi:hypothetical protein